MSVLDLLYRNRVVGFGLTGDRARIEVSEACDYYFTELLTKAQVGQLIEELQALHREMIDGE